VVTLGRRAARGGFTKAWRWAGACIDISNAETASNMGSRTFAADNAKRGFWSLGEWRQIRWDSGRGCQLWVARADHNLSARESLLK
jgi:hypothetical protein